MGGDGIEGGAEEEAGAGGVQGTWVRVKEDVERCVRRGEGEGEAGENFRRPGEDGCSRGFEWCELFSGLGWRFGCENEG